MLVSTSRKQWPAVKMKRSLMSEPPHRDLPRSRPICQVMMGYELEVAGEPEVMRSTRSLGKAFWGVHKATVATRASKTTKLLISLREKSVEKRKKKKIPPMWERSDEEVEAMAAIFGEDFSESESSATVRAAPGVTLTFFWGGGTAVSVAWLRREEEEALAEMAGRVSLFDAVERVREEAEKTRPVKEEHEEGGVEEEEGWGEGHVVGKSEVLRDRRSRFLGFCFACGSEGEARRGARRLRSSEGLEGATHVIVAWRGARGCGRDDDGEGGAGDWVLRVMEQMRVEEACVVVARWFGGVKLGPDRFRNIGLVSKEAIEAMRKM